MRVQISCHDFFLVDTDKMMLVDTRNSLPDNFNVHGAVLFGQVWGVDDHDQMGRVLDGAWIR